MGAHRRVRAANEFLVSRRQSSSGAPIGQRPYDCWTARTTRVTSLVHSRTDYRAHKIAIVDRRCGSGQCARSCRWQPVFCAVAASQSGPAAHKSRPSCLRSIRMASARRPGPLAKSIKRAVARERCIKSIPSIGSSARKRTPPPAPRTSLVTFSMNEDPYTK